ncbi:hypothetical protein [Shewanella gelidii]|uniref:Uncharacterized protein n=1 Tax=Shewanella gelidii TaxID=1642821 RepID=A0A917JPM6_9GAMM|nr:hypothetical protein [Shewanella gelidii]MCL1097807.1 hypothetical protein [Shewanella gelidii]GGI78608.1 hypothetical protein GCM10009332_15010 [Shewanella gelidii]
MKSILFNCMVLILLVVAIAAIPALAAEKIVVRKSSESFDAFAVRDQLLKDHQWQEQLRMQQQINILQSLPVGCIVRLTPYRHYQCGAALYRPYSYQNQQLYIQTDPIQNQPNSP